MKQYLLTLLILVCCGFPGTAQGQTVIISNDFGAGADIGPGFQLLSNGVGGNGTFDPDSGIVTTASANNNTTGFNNVSLTTLDSLTTSIETEFVITSADVTGLDANGFFLGLVTGTNATDQTGAGLFNNDPAAIGILLQNGNGVPDNVLMIQDPDGGTPALTGTALTTQGFPTAASLADGFTLNFTIFDDNTFTASSTGLSEDFNSSGTLDTSGTFPVFADFVAGGIGVNGSIQGDNGTAAFTIDSVTVSSFSAVPEPTSTGIICLGLFGLVTRRRRA